MGLQQFANGSWRKILSLALFLSLEIAAARPSKCYVTTASDSGLVTRRLSQGRIRWWPEDQDAPLHPLQAQQLSVLLYNGLPDQAGFAPAWRKLPGVDTQAASDSASSPL